jgi:hypothetical protein
MEIRLILHVQKQLAAVHNELVFYNRSLVARLQGTFFKLHLILLSPRDSGEGYSNSGRLSVRPSCRLSVRLSVHHTFLFMR